MRGLQEKTMRALVICCLAVLSAADVFAQTDRNATLTVTVTDETRGVLAGATVTLAGIDPANKGPRSNRPPPVRRDRPRSRT